MEQLSTLSAGGALFCPLHETFKELACKTRYRFEKSTELAACVKYLVSYIESGNVLAGQTLRGAQTKLHDGLLHARAAEGGANAP